MESHLNFKYRFKIEKNPDGGYVARQEGGDLAVEGATKEEVEQKMLEKISAAAGPQVAEALKGMSLTDLKSEGGVRVERKFSVMVNGKRVAGSGGGADALPGAVNSSNQSIGPVMGEEGGISKQLLWAIIAGLALVVFWLLAHRG